MRDKCIAFIFCYLLMANRLNAASGAGEDSSNIFTWIFLGMIGLIVAVLLIPATRSILGLARGVEKRSEAAEEKVPK